MGKIKLQNHFNNWKKRMSKEENRRSIVRYEYYLRYPNNEFTKW